MRPNIGMNEIAKMFGVSKVTISKALNDKEGVSEDLRREIKAKAEELGYRINSAARCLKNNRNYNIGVLIPARFVGTNDSYYFGAYAKLVVKFKEIGYSVILEILEDVDEQNLNYPEMYVNHKIDGLIIMGQLSNEYLKKFEDFDIAVVFFDFYSNNSTVDNIVVDNYYSGFELTDYLIKRGHKEIGFVGSLFSTSSIQDRFLGFYRALLGNNISYNECYHIEDRNKEGHLIDLVLPQKMPTAFVCNNDQGAYELIKLLKKNGYNVPNDISVVAFDNTIYSSLSLPKITTIDTNLDEMVNVASKVILKKITNPNKVYNRILVKTTLIIRDSVKERM